MTGPRRVQLVRGPLSSWAAGYASELARRGYSLSAVRKRLWQLDHLSRWLGEEGLSPSELTSERVEQFLQARRVRGYKCWVADRSMDLPLGYLRDLGVAPPMAPIATDAVGELLGLYRRYLLEERGLTDKTVTSYQDVARLFLAAQSTNGDLDPGAVSAAEVIAFVGHECARCSVRAAQHNVVAVRCLLRYLHVAGAIATPLATVVPSVASRRGASLPRGLAAADVARLMASCDRRRVVGRRDYAILTLLVRLGLRAGEVAALELDDVDWRRGEILIRGKGDRQERLPLPCDVGEAVVGYLRRGRPRNPQAGRRMFVRVVAPMGGLHSKAIGAVVHDACVRAGLTPVGSHGLRHSAATEMLRAGASLPEVAQVLRHRRLDTTSIYAKVDRAALRTLAQPWPGGAS